MVNSITGNDAADAVLEAARGDKGSRFICPQCGYPVPDKDLAAQGYAPKGPYPSHDEVARIARGGEPDDDDLAAQKTIDDFNKGREGDYYRARPGVASSLLGAARRLRSSKEV